MIQITWMQTEPYEWTGTEEKENYVLTVHKIFFSTKWSWWIFRDEDRILHSQFEDDADATTRDEAKQRAERALDNYLKEQDNYVNLLHAVVEPKESQLERDIERLKFYNDKP